MAHKQDPEHEQEQAKEQEQMPLVIVRLDTKGSKTPLQVAHSILAVRLLPLSFSPLRFSLSPSPSKPLRTATARVVRSMFAALTLPCSLLHPSCKAEHS